MIKRAKKKVKKTLKDNYFVFALIMNIEIDK